MKPLETYETLRKEFLNWHYEKHLEMCTMLRNDGERNRSLFQYTEPTFEEFNGWLKGENQ